MASRGIAWRPRREAVTRMRLTHRCMRVDQHGARVGCPAHVALDAIEDPRPVQVRAPSSADAIQAAVLIQMVGKRAGRRQHRARMMVQRF